MSPDLAQKLTTLPDAPGVYLFKDSKGRIIYVGKAKVLRHRVRSYFSNEDDGRYQYPKLVASIRDFEIILTRDEVEALTTEAALIRKHRPRYNIDLNDDKSYPFIKVTNEPFPRVLLTRKPEENPPGDVYGPYTDVRNTRYLLRTLKGALQIRDCSLPLTEKSVEAGRFKLCLDYHIGRCGGPCEGKVNIEEYRKGVDRFVQFLSGHQEDIVAQLEADMRGYSDELRFEDAAAARDRLLTARRFLERQRIVDHRDAERDAIGLSREDNYAAFSVINVRGGRIVGQSPFHMDRTEGLSDGELLEAFVVRHYDLTDNIPRDVFLAQPTDDMETLGQYLTNKAGRKVHVFAPQRGEKQQLITTANANAEQLMLERRVMSEKRAFVPRSLKALQELLGMDKVPTVIECFDISHLAGLDSVASMVMFRDAKPYKAGYRIFKIKSFEGIDDFAAIGEAVRRRYTRVLDESQVASPKSQVTSLEIEEADFEDDVEDIDDPNSKPKTQNPKPTLPDLILIDGGIGQLNRAKQVLTELGLDELPAIGLAKRLEEIYLPGDSDPLTLPRTSSALKLLQQLRDEAHRFAITRHRLLRGKRQVRSRLDDIAGIGPSRRIALLKRFGSVKRITDATVDEIAAVPGMNGRVAARLIEGLKEPTGESPT